ncbi:hypothetical protein PG993_000841 [Apiospora rasikravindrae]|uniref:Uncharacterized protein n=1 Tax=Apiospora rasikravindrae TaxID=990691 RepID=A0ABR1U9Q6_9PEZI
MGTMGNTLRVGERIVIVVVVNDDGAPACRGEGATATTQTGSFSAVVPDTIIFIAIAHVLTSRSWAIFTAGCI